MASTLLLDVDTWDLVVDNSGNIAKAAAPYALAQDAASAIRLFAGELYFDTSQGIPYFEQILGHYPPISLLKAYFDEQALTVPGVVKAQSFITFWSGRIIRGQVQIMDELGNVSAAGF